MDINAVYEEVGTFRATAAICGTIPKTVKRVVNAAEAASERYAGGVVAVAHNYEGVAAERVAKTGGRISAKRLLPVARTAGYEGSDRNFRRLAAESKTDWSRSNHRGRRPGVWAPGAMLVIDWGEISPLYVFCAVLAWSRWRFVFFADNLRAETTMGALARCFEAMGGARRRCWPDRKVCLKGATVAGVVVPTDYVRFANHYRCRPDFCQGADPNRKGGGEPGRLLEVRPPDPRGTVGGRPGHCGRRRRSARSDPSPRRSSRPPQRQG